MTTGKSDTRSHSGQQSRRGVSWERPQLVLLETVGCGQQDKSKRAGKWLVGKLYSRGRGFTLVGAALLTLRGSTSLGGGETIIHRGRPSSKMTSAPGGHNAGSNGRSRVYDLWIESSDDAGVITTVFTEVTDLGTAQSGVKCQVGNLTGEAQLWGFSVYFPSGKRLFSAVL